MDLEKSFPTLFGVWLLATLVITGALVYWVEIYLWILPHFWIMSIKALVLLVKALLIISTGYAVFLIIEPLYRRDIKKETPGEKA